ncbi:MAG TPA: hypothetical protein VFV03_08975 [Solirubrobacteraceae bacterium]|nr:hypothetical protein [Solirubrobacteraceae bacterium]
MSLVGAIALPLLTSTTVLLAVCVGLLGAIVTLNWDHLNRFMRRVEAENQHKQLLAVIERTPSLARTLSAIATSAKEIVERDGNRGVFVERLMEAKLDDAETYLKGLDAGEVRVEVRGVGPMLQLMDIVGESLMATTIPESDDEWWHSQEGREYLELNRRAIDRGVEIKRIVLWSTVSLELARVVVEQREAGVLLLFARLDGAAGLRTNVAIYDGQIYHEVAYEVDGTPNAYAYCDIPSRVEGKIKLFEDLNSTTDLPPGLEELLREVGSGTL